MPASRSLIALLIGTVAFFALWLVALKPSGSGSGKNGSSSSQGLGQYQSAINAAHHAVATSNASNAASGNDGTGSSPSTAPTSTKATSPAKGKSAKPATSSATKAKPVPHLTAKVGAHNKATLVRLSTVQRAMAKHKMVVMLFYNPAGADDQAVRQMLAAVPTHHGKVVKLTIPLSESANFTPVTNQVPVNFSPTLVLIAPSGQTEQIIGFSDQYEIAQRVDQGLSSH
jgi:hypothetical protein